MVDQPRGECFEIKVDHAVRTDDHCRALLAKCFDNASERVRSTVQIIRIKLHGITPTGV